MTTMDRPRVLRAEEIAEHDGAVLIEYRDRERYGEDWALFFGENYPGFQFLTVHAGKLWLPLECYNVDWRAWTRRPDEKDRAREPWGRTLKW